MSAPLHIPTSRRAITALDLALILVASSLAEAGHFAIRQGRHVISADSVQYVDGARALLEGRERAHFDFRKPGYSLVLAATALVFGNMAWAAILVNHIFQALMPCAAYLLGRSLHSRAAGWLAAVFVVALLQAQHRADRIMSETVYTTIATFGLAAAAMALCHTQTTGNESTSKVRRSLRADKFEPARSDGNRVTCGGTFSIVVTTIAGLLLGAAWFLRANAVAAIGGVLIAIFLRKRRPSIVLALGFLVPIAGFALLECGVNHRFAGEFRPGTGTMGPGLLMRARGYLNLPLPDSPAAQRCVALLPERDPDDAFAEHRSDVWVAWYRARHAARMTEWEMDNLMRDAGWEALRQAPVAHFSNAFQVFVRYLLRRTDGSALSRATADRTGSPIPPPGNYGYVFPSEQPYIPWALPLRTSQESGELVSEMLRAAETSAPFGQTGLWADLRFAVMHPLTVDVLGVVRHVATVWPGFALLLCPWLGLNRRICLMLAAGYLLDALIVANFTSSEDDLARYAYVWLATDATLVAGMVAGLFNHWKHWQPVSAWILKPAAESCDGSNQSST